MHSYSTDADRLRWFAVFTVVSVLVAPLITAGFNYLIHVPAWLVGSPTLAGVFVAISWVFNEWLWKLKLPGGRTVSGTPDLSGIYRGELQSDYESDGQKATRSVELVIEQKWMSLVVRMKVTDDPRTSRSFSTIAAVCKSGSHDRINYTYTSQVMRGVAEADMSSNLGTADLELDSQGELVGPYFNDRPRSGTLMLQKLEV